MKNSRLLLILLAATFLLAGIAGCASSSSLRIPPKPFLNPEFFKDQNSWPFGETVVLNTVPFNLSSSSPSTTSTGTRYGWIIANSGTRIDWINEEIIVLYNLVYEKKSKSLRVDDKKLVLINIKNGKAVSPNTIDLKKIRFLIEEKSKINIESTLGSVSGNIFGSIMAMGSGDYDRGMGMRTELQNVHLKNSSSGKRINIDVNYKFWYETGKSGKSYRTKGVFGLPSGYTKYKMLFENSSGIKNKIQIMYKKSSPEYYFSTAELSLAGKNVILSGIEHLYHEDIRKKGYIFDCYSSNKSNFIKTLWQDYSYLDFAVSPNWDKFVFLEKQNSSYILRFVNFKLPN